ncbi:hypothetical protein [Ferroplasma sp. Type II]|nr:hypothetical protein [Ferroplasma sp. Type II]
MEERTATNFGSGAGMNCQRSSTEERLSHNNRRGDVIPQKTHQ